MQELHIYGRLYCRGNETSFQGEITIEKLEELKAMYDDDDDEGLEDFSDADWNIASLIIGAFMDDEINIEALKKGESQAIFIEEYAGGIGPTLRDAKVAFVDAEESW